MAKTVEPAKKKCVNGVLQDVIGRWQEFVEDHAVYQNNQAQCVEWVATLRKRLQICGDLAGDKQDVEDRLIKLQVRPQFIPRWERCEGRLDDCPKEIQMAEDWDKILCERRGMLTVAMNKTFLWNMEQGSGMGE